MSKYACLLVFEQVACTTTAPQLLTLLEISVKNIQLISDSSVISMIWSLTTMSKYSRQHVFEQVALQL